jgi:hypothetical protein
MASWCNARLVVVGHPSDVTRFRRLAGAPVARMGGTRLTPSADARASRVFRGDMLVGEAQGLFCERATRIARTEARRPGAEEDQRRTHEALSRQAHSSAQRRGSANRRGPAQKALRTKGAAGRHVWLIRRV